MPLTARCKKCGHILYDGDFTVRRGTTGYTSPVAIIPRYIIKIHEGKCPKCGRKLEMPSIGDVEVLPNPEFDFPWRKKNEPRRSDNSSTQEIQRKSE